MTNWLSIFKHLLPNAKAWRLTIEKTLKDFFDGLTVLGVGVKNFLDDVFDDIDPQKTRQLDLWEIEFGLQGTGLSEQERRDRLDATWKAVGGQSPRYIQDTLQARGFDVYVHEWWEPSIEHPTGGSVNGDVTPVVRNPLTYLDDGSDAVQTFLMVDGAEDAQDGDPVAQDGSTGTPAGYPLVNKILISTTVLTGDGEPGMNDGAEDAQDGSVVVNYSQKQYTIPNDPVKFPFFLYIGGQIFPEQANVLQSRRDEFEDLCLKICPTEQWLGILVDYG